MLISHEKHHISFMLILYETTLELDTAIRMSYKSYNIEELSDKEGGDEQ